MIPLLLLPGMMCDSRLFTPQIAAFSGTRAVHCAPITGHDSVANLAAEVLTNAPRRFALAGLSMGGIVAMEVLRQAPDRVAGLALLDTNPLAEKSEVKASRKPQMEAVRNGNLWNVMREEMKPKYLADGPGQGVILDLCMEMAMGLGSQVFLNQSKVLMARSDQRDTLRRYAGPSLVLCGREDTLCPVHRHELMHDLLADSRLDIIENAGHLPVLEQPEQTTAALTRWLEDI